MSGIRPGQAKGPYVGESGSTTVTAGANVGTGTGEVFRDIVAHTINLRTLKQGLGITITTAGDEVTIAATAFSDLYWLNPVISIYDNSAALPVGPSAGDRYIALTTANGWTVNHVYEWDGVSAWTDTTPLEGMAIYIKSTDIIYTWDGSGWQANSTSTSGYVPVYKDVQGHTENSRMQQLSNGMFLTTLAGAPGEQYFSLGDEGLEKVWLTKAATTQDFYVSVSGPGEGLRVRASDAHLLFAPYTTDGILTVNYGTGEVSVIPGATTNHYTGFPNRTDSTLTWDDGTYTLTITGTFDIWINGTKYTPTAPQKTKQITDVTGLYWLWYTAPAGVPTLNASTVHPGFDKCLVATVYWNTTTNKGALGDERHWMGRDRYNHEYLHETVGARYASGLGGAFTNTTFTITAGEFYDEDIEHIITPNQTTTDVYYKNGSADWEWDAANVRPYKLNGTSMRYNNVNALADVPVGKYVAMWMFATNETVVPLITLIGQRYDDNLAQCRANALPTALVLGTLPSAEMKLLYRIIYTQNAGSVTFVEATDYRVNGLTTVSAFVAADHAALTNLAYNVSGHTGFYTLEASEISATTLKASPTTSDFLLIEDAASSNAKKRITIGTLPAAAPAAHDLAGALHNADSITNLNSKLSDGDVISTKPGEINALTAKTSPTASDLLMIEDAADSNNKKKITSANLSPVIFPQYTFIADQFDFPNNSDWTVNNPAPLTADSVKNGLYSRTFDDTAEEGVGFTIFIPAGVTSLTFQVMGRAQTAPGVAKQVILNLYNREIIDNAAVEAWTSATVMTAIDITTNAYYQYDSQTITLTTLGITAGRLVQFELTRNGASGSDTLVDDWNLLCVRVVLS